MISKTQKSNGKTIGWGDWTPQFIMENWYKTPNPFANIIAQQRNKVAQ